MTYVSTYITMHVISHNEPCKFLLHLRDVVMTKQM